MINLKINDIPVTVEDDTTILDAAKKVNINIPTLCYLKDYNKNASCRMCLVEVKGARSLLTACSTKVSENMEVFTNTDKVVESRKNNLELILSNHDKDCDHCLKKGKCYLEKLFDEHKTNDDKYGKFEDLKEIDVSTTYIVRDPNKCILCGRCVEICRNVQGISVIGKNKRGIKSHIGCAFEADMVNSPCIACGQCILVCPTGALSEKDDVKEVQEALNNPNLHVVVATAPSVRVTLGEEFNLPLGTNVKGQMVAALRRLGFAKIFDVNLGADLTIMEEVNELVERIKENKNLPMFTSCSPGWIKYVEHYHSDMINNLSTCKSPQQMLGSIIKTYYAKKNNIDPKNIYVVMIMPCIAKKFEKNRDNQNASGYPDVDAVLTTRELARFIKKQQIDFNGLPEEDFDHPLGEGASVIFGSSGGVMEAALRTLVELSTHEKLNDINFTQVRGLKGVKEASYVVNGRTINVAVVSGIKNAKDILKKIKNKEVNYDFVEFMTCPGGCINGGGQPFIDFTKYSWDEAKKLRVASILNEDEHLVIRKAHENEAIKEIYKTFLGKPGSELAEEILHTKYKQREKYKKN